MFLMIGGGEKAGSGIDKIRQGWASQNLQAPRIEETTRPDRVRFLLPTVSLLPQPILDKLYRQFGESFQLLSSTEIQSLVIAEQEGEVSNGRMRLACTDHAADLTRMLQGLVGKGFFEQLGQKRGTSYRITSVVLAPNSQHSEPNSQHNGPNSQHNGPNSQHSEPNSQHNGPNSQHSEPLQSNDKLEKNERLLAIAQPAREKARLDPEAMQRLIAELCRGRYLTASELAALLDREAITIQQGYLRGMVKANRLSLRYPEEPNHPQQAYTTTNSETVGN